MVGNKSRPKKDRGLKVSGGQPVKAGQILGRGLAGHKAGKNVEGKSNFLALCDGIAYFTYKKVNRGKFRTFINIKPASKSR